MSREKPTKEEMMGLVEDEIDRLYHQLSFLDSRRRINEICDEIITYEYCHKNAFGKFYYPFVPYDYELQLG